MIASEPFNPPGSRLLIFGGQVYRDGAFALADILIENGRILGADPSLTLPPGPRPIILDATGHHVFPGVIDPQVHFRDPGGVPTGALAEDLGTGSIAAAAGGVTGVLDMPNTVPPCDSRARLSTKRAAARAACVVNYGFFLAYTGDNLAELNAARGHCGIKLFCAHSTGDLGVFDPQAIERLFAETDPNVVIAVHAEDQALIDAQTAHYRATGRTDAGLHALIRDAEVCRRSTERLVALAHKYAHRLHVLHVSTKVETTLLSADDPYVTAETCPQYLLLTDEDVARAGNLLRCNPAIKSAADRDGLWDALYSGKLTVVATDHAPHARASKLGSYWDAPSGLPSIENAVALMLDAAHRGRCTPADVARWMSEGPARAYRLSGKGEIVPGADADLTLVDLAEVREVRDANQRTKCGWSPFSGTTLTGWPVATLIGGRLCYYDGQVDAATRGSEFEIAGAAGAGA